MNNCSKFITMVEHSGREPGAEKRKGNRFTFNYARIGKDILTLHLENRRGTKTLERALLFTFP